MHNYLLIYCAKEIAHTRIHKVIRLIKGTPKRLHFMQSNGPA